VWVLVPTVETTDPNLAYYNDFSQGEAEYARAFAALGTPWQWTPVTMAGARGTLEAALEAARTSSTGTPIMFNLCDGDEINGSPGLSVIHLLNELGLDYTGSDVHFFDITTSKIVMKRAFERANVPTSPWEVIPPDGSNIPGIFDRLGAPLILKPAISAGSLGIGTKNVVSDEAALREQFATMQSGYRGWELADGGIFVERFVQGPEYTTFIIGSHDAPERRVIYAPVERLFHEDLPENEKFLSFDRLWEIYEQETPIGNDEYLWNYKPVSGALADEIMRISWDAYAALGGRGYGRVDLRQDRATGALQVLEVNAQCGLSEDENHTSIGAILRFAATPFSTAVRQILDEALERRPTDGAKVT
jgi:D-alanine-D-alanine ligase